jgi:hypothetical protein
MHDSRDAVQCLAASVLSDGSIEVELSIPGQEESVETTIHATPKSAKLAPSERRDVDLDDDGEIEDKPFRQMIAACCSEIQRQVDARRAQVQGRGAAGRRGGDID